MYVDDEQADDLAIDKANKAFSMTVYYMKQAQIRTNDQYYFQAMEYCEDVFRITGLSENDYEKARLLRMSCMLQLAKGKSSDLQCQWFSRIAQDYAYFLKQTQKMRYLFDTLKKDLLSDFIAWYEKNTGANKQPHDETFEYEIIN